MKMKPVNAREFIQMEYSEFPETQITRIRACIGRMESALVLKFGVKRS